MGKGEQGPHIREPRDHVLGSPGTTTVPGKNNGAWEHNRAWGPQKFLGITMGPRDHNGAQGLRWRPGTTMEPRDHNMEPGEPRTTMGPRGIQDNNGAQGNLGQQWGPGEPRTTMGAQGNQEPR